MENRDALFMRLRTTYGAPAIVAKELGLSRGNIAGWTRIPPRHRSAVEKALSCIKPKKARSFDWTKDKTIQLAQLVKEGKSRSDCAKETESPAKSVEWRIFTLRQIHGLNWYDAVLMEAKPSHKIAKVKPEAVAVMAWPGALIDREESRLKAHPCAPWADIVRLDKAIAVARHGVGPR